VCNINGDTSLVRASDVVFFRNEATSMGELNKPARGVHIARSQASLDDGFVTQKTGKSDQTFTF
jgi:hypothetical protein